MTFPPDADPTDAELALAAAAGDPHALAAIYDRYADRLHDFCIGMLRDRDAAADCVQDTFCTAAARLAQLREPDKLRSWLYAVARNEALRRIRARRRERSVDAVPEVASSEAGPEVLAARSALADLVTEAAGGLSDRDRVVLELSYYHGLDGPELAEALEASPAAATKMVQRLRDTVERSLGALLVAGNAGRGPNACAGLAAVLDGWDGRFTVLMRKRVARHIEACGQCDDERRRRVSPQALLGATPVFVPAPPELRERTLSAIQLTSAATELTHSRSNTARLLAVVGAAMLALSVIVFVAVGRAPQTTPVSPVDMEATTTKAGRPPAGFVPPPATTGPAVAPRIAEPVTSVPTMTAPASPERPAGTDPATATVRQPRPTDDPDPTSPVTTAAQDSAVPTTPRTTAPKTTQPRETAPETTAADTTPMTTPPRTAPARTVPPGPLQTFTPDEPVVTTVPPIG
ncbi:RNA polymerase sigma factor [Mycolicibacterium chlorophenolicum]|uniref:ECF RNA polymerase sigma factor SigW n=1 Tax=Mycolicibacterium chlorophenolicum TaxID=37916 RepID=A0A0J6VF83_9MYCO|nr:sigma-70 family RNA polymerase sigma factor [Mycolicibacterium chlorophenolicum]KMO69675.1 ECF RNA polymerase sigma factor SigW [Mycolicibacterium chlorophenolicum]